MRPLKPGPSFALLAGLAIATSSFATEDDEIYSCADDSGTIVIQTDPCPAPALAPPAAPPPPPKAAPPKPATERPRGEPPRVTTLRTRHTTWQVVPRSERPAPPPRREFGRLRFETSA
ncbi:MAG TPA: hypothetical protein VD788_02490, partial [Candidatus Polarisedimenticolaceae bacterium]|nr:hypothetical protein [Candidatus Polarisedimenticolaceae bacterium]